MLKMVVKQQIFKMESLLCRALINELNILLTILNKNLEDEI